MSNFLICCLIIILAKQVEVPYTPWFANLLVAAIGLDIIRFIWWIVEKVEGK